MPQLPEGWMLLLDHTSYAVAVDPDDFGEHWVEVIENGVKLWDKSKPMDEDPIVFTSPKGPGYFPVSLVLASSPGKSHWTFERAAERENGQENDKS
jgi:hypothetical protein